MDVPGTWQHFTVPMHELEVETFVEGKAFDGSSIRGFQTINESDMLVIPDPSIGDHGSLHGCSYLEPDA